MEMEITISSQPPLTVKGRSRYDRILMHSLLWVRGSWREIVTFCILIFAFCIGAQNASAGTIIKSPAYLGLQNGLVGCWTFDGSYTKAPDCSGNNNTGTLTNGPIKTSGKIGQSLQFDGVNDYVDTNFNFPAGTTVTVSVWVKLTSGGWYVVGNHPTAGNLWFLGNKSGTNFATFRYESNEVEITLDGSVTNIKNGAWHHLAAVTTASNAYLYVD